MARGIALSTAGVSLSYCVETTANTRPTANYTRIHDIKEIPDFNPEPESIEATDLEEENQKFYVAGLKDQGGALGFVANLTETLRETWSTLCEAAATATATNKRVWFQIQHPKLSEAVFFSGEPASMGLPSMGVSAVLETTIYITPTSAPEWAEKVENK